MTRKKPKGCHVYTDGSYCPISGKSGFGVYCPDHTQLCLCGSGLNLPNNQRAEFLAIEQALGKIVANEAILDRVVICTDSLVAINRIREIREHKLEPWKGSGLRSIRTLLRMCEMHGITVILQKVPAHQGVVGNEIADRLAYKAMQEGLSSSKEPATFSDLLDKLECRYLVKRPRSIPVPEPVLPVPVLPTPVVVKSLQDPLELHETDPLISPRPDPDSSPGSSKGSFWRALLDRSRRGIVELLKTLLLVLGC